MTNDYAKHFNPTKTPQNRPIPGKESDMKKNAAGGYTFTVDPWKQFKRFLILGTEGGTFYATEQELTIDNAKATMHCIQENPERALNEILEVITNVKAVSYDPAIFALALMAAHVDSIASDIALRRLGDVCRTGSHLLRFVDWVDQFRGWGRGLRKAISKWYKDKELGYLAYQVLKYKSRYGWSHRDVLRKAHPDPHYHQLDDLFGYITQDNMPDAVELSEPGHPLSLIFAFEEAKGARTEGEIIELINDYELPRELVPTEWLNYKGVWEALLPHMPMWATVRNLGKMTEVGVIKPLGEETEQIAERLKDREQLKKARMHPISILVALVTYESGGGALGSLTWEPNMQIIDALDTAFYKSFDVIEPTGKRVMYALDVSGSMKWCSVMNKPGLTPRNVSAALALVNAKTEKHAMFHAFSDRFVPVTLSGKERLDDVVKKMTDMPFGGTDCSLPAQYAINNELDIDAFVIYTDNETWAGDSHPVQTFQEYAQRFNPNARMITVGMTATESTIADPNDPRMLDIVGMSTSTPNVINQFIKGEI